MNETIENGELDAIRKIFLDEDLSQYVDKHIDSDTWQACEHDPDVMIAVIADYNQTMEQLKQKRRFF